MTPKMEVRDITPELKPKNMPYSGVMCYPDTKNCRVWWAQTIGNRTITATLIIQNFERFGKRAHDAEKTLEDILNESVVNLEGVE